MADNLITIENLSKGFNGKMILNNLNMSVFRGENLVVFGKSGSGKSVLLKCIIGLMKPDSGKIYVGDRELQKMNSDELNTFRKRTGFLFQGAALYDSMSVRENLAFPLIRNTEMNKQERDKKIINTLDLVSLGEAIDKMPSELSGGMRKRIGLARAIITDPEIMFYDEPTTGLDPITSKEISELIIALQHRLHMTSIVVTHDLICAKIISDRSIFLKDGDIIYNGILADLAGSDDPFLKNFFSDEPIKSGD
ncbi:MAG: ATP-binding cassette domain-containing protein [Ignavibacteriales bacterium]|nr:ATP-binding cassette domain-containing protein [Ignavibacteriales bacterium]MCF8305710.1 ATP-binding cassette domain-containing protein [Ignavibacteriales bacterium]MCF8315432.1 ATP-binding cassette domain-containing protein [Ignavibacteriales bacterium]MCF8437040.1 ATP-binding cassette domain-containing protein [Ignavibacteriales bacterium]